jgi:TonB-dependent receptor-like protein
MKFEPALGSGFVLNYSYAVKPNLVVTAGAGWFGEINNQFNITNYSPTEVAGSSIPPYITFDGQHTLTSWGTQGSWLRSINRKLGLAFSNNYLWTKGKNTFNIGWEFRRAYQDDNEEQTAGGQFAFSQAQTSIHNPNDPNYGADGSSFASFLLGLPNAVNRSNSQELRLRNRDLSPYIQDDIKLSRKLTLNVGLRWDIQVPFTENNNLIVFFDPSIANPAADGLSGAVTKFGDCTGCAGYTHADIHWGHVGPRFGASYQLNDKTVLQGGFSVSFLNGGAYEYGTNKVAVNYGNLLVGAFSRASTGSFTSSYGSWDAQQLVNPPATPFSNGLGVGTQVDAFNRNDGYAPYSEQWNFSIQRELPSGIFFTAAWIGNREVHLTSQLNAINQLDPKFLALGNDLSLSFADGSAQAAGYTEPYANFVNDFAGSATVSQSLVPFPQFGKIFNNFEGSGTAYYQSGQIEVEKRFKKGLAFLAGYTLSRSWDNTSSGFSSFTNGALNKFNQKLEWGASTSDEPNTLKVSGTYELPFGPNKPFANKHGVVGQIVGGWQVGWVLDYEAGTAFGVGENGTPFPTIGGGNRPDRNGAVKLSTSSYKNELDFYLGKGQGQIFANNSFTTTPSQYVLGNSQRAYFELRNPHFMNENLNALRTFNFGEHLKGKLQVAYFNAFNRVQFNGPDTNASDGAAFGQAHSQGQNNGNRQGQAMFRLEF